MVEVFFIAIVVLAIALGIYSSILARRRREALASLCASLGLAFDPERDYSVDERYGFLSKLCQGSNRYAFNRCSGNYEGHEVLAFYYNYETHSHDSKGRRQTHHHHLACFMLHLPGASFPELTICREGWGSKIAQWIGYDDIDFESAEFSRRFCVRSANKKFAYDICHPRMIDYLLAHPDLSLEIERDCLCLMAGGSLGPEELAFHLKRLVELRTLFPDYLWTTWRPS